MTFSTLVDLVKVYTPTSGQGALTLGAAVPGFLTPSTVNPAMTSGAVVSYGIHDPSGNEVGQGILTLTGSVWTLTRGVTQSSNGGAPILCTGQATVALTLRAEDVLGKSGIWRADPGVTLNFSSDTSIILDAPLITAAGSDGMTVQSEGSLNIGTNNETGATRSSDTSIYTGDTGSGHTGQVNVFSGVSTAAGGRTGDVLLQTGDAPSDASGDVRLITGTAGGTRGNIILDAPIITSPVGSLLELGTQASASSDGADVFSGNGTTKSGAVSIGTGNASNGPTGDNFVYTGFSNNAVSGQIGISTGQATGANSGAISLVSGNSVGGNSGTVELATGTATGTRGSIRLDAHTVVILNLPTSSAGLDPGTIWSNGGVLCVA